ncbi:MAG: SusC/RagA family TonB-linked outer membrane protein [Dysgonamonadaceae bacterium]|jgi:TonB-linked SusC/RagA family outer membrane protein|nr:SusC/RagA family TonB-linked outer membrane protein [Dysgonamonadaceae bacterium]
MRDTKKFKMYLLSWAVIMFGWFQASPVHAQKEVKKSVTASGITVTELIKKLGAEYPYSFFIADKDAAEITVSVNLKEATAEQVLTQAFIGKDLSFTKTDKTITIAFKPQQDKRGQLVTYDGIVTDGGGDPVIGASVWVKGTTIGTVTDVDGRFAIKAPAGSRLTVSYIGFSTQEINPGENTNLQIELHEDVATIDEVVVVGYGTMRKKDLTGAIIQIRPDKIADENPKTVQDILRGTPGLNVGFDASAKGGGSMQIRGQRSVYTENGHNDPLLIVDGMIFYGELSEINPDDIGQIDVLKDASAASVYGAKAANGVIIITTKKGQMGKPIVNFTANMGFSTQASNREVFGAEGYLKYREDWYTTQSYGLNPATNNYEAYQSDVSTTAAKKGMLGYFNEPTPGNLSKWGITLDQWKSYTVNASEYSDREIWARRLLMQDNTLTNFLAGNTFDWYDHSFRTGVSQDHNISVSGANNQINYYLSLGYLSNEGVVVGNNYRAVRSNVKLNAKVTDWFEVGANINFQDRTDGDVPADWGTQIINNSPFATYSDEDGNPVVHPMGDLMSNNKGYNYDFNRKYIELEKGYTVLNSILNAKIKLPFNVIYSFNASPRYQYFYDRYWRSADHPDWKSPDSERVNREQSKRFDWSINNTINWDYTVADYHHLNLTLVQEAEERQFWKDRIEAKNILPTDALGFHRTENAEKDRSKFLSEDRHETADGLLARLFYSFDNKYMFTGSIRRDGYSAFGTSNPRATFFSIAFAWAFANEKFFKWEPLSTGKLRLSWGQNGNRSLDNPYVALANLVPSVGTVGYIDVNNNLLQSQILRLDRLANTHLQWEKTAAWNVGLDFGFLNNRVTGTLDYYVMPTTDMIMNQALPGFSGFSSITCNLGEVENRGFEISINSQNIKNRNFEWNTTVGFTKYKNAIKHLYYQYEAIIDDLGNIVGEKETNDITNKWFIGQPISAIWDYRVTGIWQTNEAEEAAKYGQRPGDPKVANSYTLDDKVNADGSTTPVYNNSDKEFLGQTAPSINWSMRNSFTVYENFDFSFNIYSKWGQKSLNGYYLNQDNGTSLVTNNANAYKKEYWTLDNPSDKYARLDAKGPAGVTSPNKPIDRSFIRLDNITVGYSLPGNLTSRLNIEKIKIYASIRNVAVWAKEWEYGDPETWTSNTSDGGGITPRIYSIGLNLTF